MTPAQDFANALTKGLQAMFAQWFVGADENGNASPWSPKVTATVSVSQAGAANLDQNHLATSVVEATLVIARPTRRSVLIKNLDTAISVYVGKATVTPALGMELRAGESMSLSYVGLIQVIAASGAPAVAYMDEYD